METEEAEFAQIDVRLANDGAIAVLATHFKDGTKHAAIPIEEVGKIIAGLLNLVEDAARRRPGNVPTGALLTTPIQTGDVQVSLDAPAGHVALIFSVGPVQLSLDVPTESVRRVCGLLPPIAGSTASSRKN